MGSAATAVPAPRAPPSRPVSQGESLSRMENFTFLKFFLLIDKIIVPV